MSGGDAAARLLAVRARARDGAAGALARRIADARTARERHARLAPGQAPPATAPGGELAALLRAAGVEEEERGRARDAVAAAALAVSRGRAALAEAERLRDAAARWVARREAERRRALDAALERAADDAPHRRAGG